MKKTLNIEGVSCGHCEGRVKKELESISGVKQAVVSATEKKAVVDLNYEVEESELVGAIEEAGYKVISVK